MPTLKKCPVCRRKFAATNSRSKFDSNACRQVAKRRRGRQQPAKTKSCSICKTPFPPNAVNQKYCSRECASNADSLAQKKVAQSKSAADEIVRQREAELKFNVDLARLRAEPSEISTVGVTLERQRTEAAKLVSQELVDAEGTRKAQIVRDERPAFDIAGYLAGPTQPSEGVGQGPSIGVMTHIRDQEN